VNKPVPVHVQPQVRAFAESLGEPGLTWLEALPATVGRLCRTWNLQHDGALQGGSRSYASRVTLLGGQSAVLKVALPEPVLRTQLSVLLSAQGHGYVQVLQHDLDQGAFLLEALGPSAEHLRTDVPSVLSLFARTLRLAWQVPHDSVPPLRSSSEHKAAGLSDLVSKLARQYAGPELDAVVAQALRYAEARLKARDASRQVVVHGDAHAGNLLQVRQARPGAETGYVFVDPEGFRCEPEYDLGVTLRDWSAQLLASSDPKAEPQGWCEQVAKESGTDAEAVWQWAYLERVSTGLYATRHGLAHLGAPFLAAARLLLEE